jgi:Uncharacterized protein conserved in bacteria (DUF2252)
MDIIEATRSYEAWLARHTPLSRADLAEKHAAMRGDAFVFLRATYYRWAQQWEPLNPALRHAPRVLGVGDLHVENFGTWRDAEGRLIWGVNDFDEAGAVPYANDLVRLAASAVLASLTQRLGIAAPRIARAVLDGYLQGLTSGGRPFVLEEHHDWLRALALNQLRDPDHYWKKMAQNPTCKTAVPGKAQRLLAANLPCGATALRILHRSSGMGSLGRQRYTALYEHGASLLAREVKARAPAAWCWAYGTRVNPGDLPAVWACGARINDPFLHATRRWIVRRLAPDCSRISLADLPQRKDMAHLLHAMGRETANIHVGAGVTRKILKHLQSLPGAWLLQAVHRMVQLTQADHRAWRSKKIK